jgi:hypothetical protein
MFNLRKHMPSEANYQKYAHWPALVAFCGFIFGMAVFGAFGDDDEISEFERRDLAQFPEVSVDRLTAGDFSDDYQEYLQDQAPFRDGFRFLKSFVSRKLLQNSENNGVFVLDQTIYDRFGAINNERIDRAVRIVGEIADDIDSDRQFIALIPTKGQALVASKYYVPDQMDIVDKFSELANVQMIDLAGFLESRSADFYYRSDPHWNAGGVVLSYNIIVDGLGLDRIFGYDSELFTSRYFGSEYGKAAAWSVEPDTIYLPRGELIDGLSTCRYSSLTDKVCTDSVYYRGAESEEDAYDVFLGGLGPIIEIENPESNTTEELVIFKDSYAHAISPLLAQHYRKVTLFDLRYMRRSVVTDNFDLDGKTVLFLYSTSVLNTDPQIVN